MLPATDAYLIDEKLGVIVIVNVSRVATVLPDCV